MYYTTKLTITNNEIYWQINENEGTYNPTVFGSFSEPAFAKNYIKATVATAMSTWFSTQTINEIISTFNFDSKVEGVHRGNYKF